MTTDPQIVAEQHAPLPRLEFAFEVRLRFTRVQNIAAMPTGAGRGAVYVDSGEFSGPDIRGKAVPNSGGDYALFRPDGVLQFDARYMLQEVDGTLILMQNRGYLWGRRADTMQKLRDMAFAGGADSRSGRILSARRAELRGREGAPRLAHAPCVRRYGRA